MNDISFDIRSASVDDVSALTEFGARTFFESFGADNTAEDMARHLASAWHPDLQRREILDASIDTLLARDSQGTLAGFAQLRDRAAPEGIETSRPVELWRFYVDRPWQGRGLARALMNAVFEQARVRGGRELWLGVWERNERARAFYGKCGFEKVGQKIFVVGTDPQTDHVMLRRL
jgi:diamine N-acetyltransferase